MSSIEVMVLWRVDVCGVSHRYVEAETSVDARIVVTRALLASMDVRATKADVRIGRAYEAAGPIKRKSLLAALDGLTNPKGRGDSRSARRRLARLIRYDQQERAWQLGVDAAAPPVSPDVVDRLIKLQEVAHAEDNFARLPPWDRDSPLHGK